MEGDGGRRRLRISPAAFEVISRSATRRRPTLVSMSSTSDGGERVPIENVRCGDPIYDADGGCQHYKVLESRALPGGGVVLELECLHDNKCQVIEKTFSAGYLVARSTRHFL